ncbi:hypothetical protein GALMADRAFT_92691 [Galerina marginata CBS 339.88]|uniref:Uncharacterized protein n=1 Tax=Galerina marginata (strain CBS 339.88) TaxID=685588 RepID=A0A067TKA8_GALM3|nr:hypothetical protein GALMADRAFT_92691 [Galerina marginata CBS 339.88]
MFPHLAFAIFTFFAQATVVSACEGSCIVSITNALLGNYTTPIAIVTHNIADSIVSHVIKNRNHAAPPISYLSPIIEEYNKRAYDYMENTIFKTYFHGKCQDPVTGIDPAGCPNPNCPVVCGTPGSIVHFYNTFRSRAFSSNVNLWNELVNPSSAAYKKVEKTVLAAALSSKSGSNNERRLFRFRRAFNSAEDQISVVQKRTKHNSEKQEDQVKKVLRADLDKFGSELGDVCGGTASAKENSLPRCSWETSFKEYILTFP